MRIEPMSAIEIAVSGLKAQRTRMNTIALNIANVTSTRTPEGGAFRRQLTLLEAVRTRPGAIPQNKLGVFVKDIVQDQSPFPKVHDPSHPDADESGYVSYPNVDLAIEMVDLVSAQRAYEANVAVVMSGKRMKQKALEIIQA